MEESRREDRIFSALEDNVFFLRQRGAKRAKARNPNNPMLSNAVAQCEAGDARARLRARGTPLLDSPIVACLLHAIRAPQPLPPHTALHFVALMWGYGDFCF